MKFFIETERFILRDILVSDIDGMFELDADPEVHRYLGNKPIKTKEQALETIRFIRRQYDEYGIGRWAIIDKKTSEFLGWSGLKYNTEPVDKYVNFYDIGYRLIKRYWGKGIASETAERSLKYAFDELKYEEILGMADCRNTGSNKILTKIGLHFIETFKYENDLCNCYKLSRQGYLSK